MPCCIPLSKRWRNSRVIWGLNIVEFALLIAFLTLAGIADPDLYRTQLRAEGSRLGFNSDPDQALFAAANGNRNYREPIVWASFATSLNVVISIVSVFLLLTKVTMTVLHCYAPIISIFVHACLVGLYGASTRIQTSPDLSDPLHPQKGVPWYLSKSCDITGTSLLKGYCLQAKSVFGLTVVLLVFYVVFVCVSVHSLIPNEAQRAKHAKRRKELKELKDHQNNRLHRSTTFDSAGASEKGEKHVGRGAFGGDGFGSAVPFGSGAAAPFGTGFGSADGVGCYSPRLAPPMSATSMFFSPHDVTANHMFNPFDGGSFKATKGPPMRL